MHCEFDAWNECDRHPCQQNAPCINKIGDYACDCPPTWSGKNCDTYDSNYPGGIFGNTPKNMSDINLERERQKCVENDCKAKYNNGRCDEECNRLACEFDGNDCSLGVNPWRNCTAPVDCWKLFMNGVCDEVCNNPQCLYDGRDCGPKLPPCK